LRCKRLSAGPEELNRVAKKFFDYTTRLWYTSFCGANSECGQPKLMDPERAMEWTNVRLCSPMFAYVRLIRKKLLGALRAAIGERGRRAVFKFLTVRDLISRTTITRCKRRQKAEGRMRTAETHKLGKRDEKGRGSSKCGRCARPLETGECPEATEGTEYEGLVIGLGAVRRGDFVTCSGRGSYQISHCEKFDRPLPSSRL
jgi:hypothetical protein